MNKMNNQSWNGLCDATFILECREVLTTKEFQKSDIMLDYHGLNTCGSKIIIEEYIEKN